MLLLLLSSVFHHDLWNDATSDPYVSSITVFSCDDSRGARIRLSGFRQIERRELIFESDSRVRDHSRVDYTVVVVV